MQKNIFFNSKTDGKFEQVTFANRNHIVFNALAIEGDTVMNKVLFPAEVVRGAYQQLEDVPAPLGHPMINGQHLDPNSPAARNQFDFGAFSKNPTMDKSDSVFVNLFIDEKRASESERGSAVLEKAKSGGEIGVSTGGTMKVRLEEGEKGGKKYSSVAETLVFNHLAVLDGEKPAGDNTYFQNSEGEVIDLDQQVINNSSTKQEENSMDKTKLITALMQNSAFAGNASELEDLSESQLAKYVIDGVNHEITFENAVKVVESKDYRITQVSEDELEDFANYKKEKAEAHTKRIELIIANNKQFTAEELQPMSSETLTKIEDSLVKKADYSGQGEQFSNSDQDDDFGEGL